MYDTPDPQVPKEALAAMMADQEAFKNFILNHVVPGTVFKEVSWPGPGCKETSFPGPQLGHQDIVGPLRQDLNSVLPKWFSQGKYNFLV